MTAEFDTALDELRHEHASVVRDQASACASLPLNELLSVFAALARSTTPAEVLTNLLKGIGREFPRVALFDVRGNRLEGVQQTGFDIGSDISKVTMPLSGDSLVSRAVSSGALESLLPGAQGAPEPGTPFGGTPVSAVAIPIVMHGSTIAVIYADDADAPEFATAVPQTRVKFVELLHQHALLVLLKVWSEVKAASELRDYARTLIGEIEQAHAEWVDAAKNPLERHHDLKVMIARARLMYVQRMSPSAPPDASALDQQLAAVAAAHVSSVFGQDLSVVLGSAGRTPRASVLTMRR
jgi:hypothetical protein